MSREPALRPVRNEANMIRAGAALVAAFFATISAQGQVMTLTRDQLIK